MTVSRNTVRKNQKRSMWMGMIVLFLLFAAAAAWKWTPLAELIDVNRLSGWAASLRHSPARHFYLLAAYVIGSILLVPITAMILVTAIIFAHQFTSAIRNPGIGAFLLLAGLIAITVVGTVWLKRRLES